MTQGRAHRQLTGSREMTEQLEVSASADTTEIAGMLERIEQLRRALNVSAAKNTADMRLLWLFSDRTPRTLRQIAQQLKLEQSTANRQVNTAVRRGLLSRTREAAGLPYLFAPTLEGLDQYRRFAEHSANAYRAGIEALGVDSNQFAALMKTFVTAIDDKLGEHW